MQKKVLRSSETMNGRRMSGARALWLAGGMKKEQMGKPVIAIANSFTQFVPGHTHLHEAGQIVKAEIEALGCYAAEFDTIAIDDGIAMGHDGMLYSLPSRDLIADSVEYMCNAHKVDALVCISNCDKITPGMLMASMRLNIPTIFVSGGPMEAGVLGSARLALAGPNGPDAGAAQLSINGGANSANSANNTAATEEIKLDLIDAMVKSADPSVSDEDVAAIEANACPGCGCCSGMFTANSMNCLTEAIGLALPGNGTVLATHTERVELFRKAARKIVENAYKYYDEGDESVLPRSIASRQAFLNAMSLDIAMGGSSNTVLHLLAVAAEAGVDFTIDDIDSLSRKVPCICKVAPNTAKYHVEDVGRAGGILGLMEALAEAGLVDTGLKRVDGLTLGEAIKKYTITKGEPSKEAWQIYSAAPARKFNTVCGSQETRFTQFDTDRANGCIRDIAHAYTKDGGLAVLKGNIALDGAIVKTAGVDESIFRFSGPVKVFDSQEEACEGILGGKVKSGDVVIIRYEGPKGGPGMQEMLYPTSYLKSMHLGRECALITDGRFSGGTSGLSMGHISPEAAAGGNIALLQDGDIVDIDIPARSINARISDEEFAARRAKEEARGAKAFTPNRDRVVPKSLKAYASMVSSADKGGVRIIND